MITLLFLAYDLPNCFEPKILRIYYMYMDMSIVFLYDSPCRPRIERQVQQV
jgi:hypothetical protein